MKGDSCILRLREYETAAIGAKWDAERKTVPSSCIAELERLQAESRTEFIGISRHQIKATNFVGVIRLGDRVIEILPKSDETDEGIRRRLVQMMSIGGMVPHLDVGIADFAASIPCLLDAFMQAYLRQLTLEWRRGRIANYLTSDKNRSYLRGKLLFHEQLRLNRLRPERFFTRSDEFLTDVPTSRLLKSAVEVCRCHGVLDATRRSAASLLPEFDEVANYAFSAADLKFVKPNRCIARFDPLIALAKLLACGCVPDRPGGVSTFSLLFDMNNVFERYVGNLMRHACPATYSVQLQSTKRSLLVRDGKQKFWLRPDIAIWHNREIAVVIDTKWKLLDPCKPHEGVRQSDIYQAYAYAREFNCPCVVLLYPHSKHLEPRVSTYDLHREGATTARIEIATIDVSRPVPQVKQQLTQLLELVMRRSGVSFGA